MLTQTKDAIKSLIRRFGYELVPVEAAIPKPVRKDYEPLLESLGVYRFKFLDVKTFLPTTIKRAYHLGLHQSKPLRVLDIGTGAGYFPVVCQYYGHSAMAIDRDGNKAFEDVTKWLNVDRRSWEIKPFEPICNLGGKFDLITAFMVNFDRFDPPDYKPWGPKEWEFFLTDVSRNLLNEDGRFAMLLNGHTAEVPSVLKYFAEKGAPFKNGWVDFKSMKSFRGEQSRQLANAR